MDPVTTAAPAVSESAPDFDISKLDSTQEHHWRMTGELPEPTKTDDSAPSKETDTNSAAAAVPDKSTETGSETASESDTDTPQEKERHRGTPAPIRRQQLADEVQDLLAKRAQLRSELGDLEGKRDAKPAASSPAAQTDPKPEPKIDDVNEKGEFKYTGANALADWMADVRKWDREQTLAEVERNSRLAEARKEMNAKMEEGRARYKDFDSVVIPATTDIVNDKAIPEAVKVALNRSPYLTDVMYVLGSDPKALAHFKETAKSDPLGAIYLAFTLENEVKAELEKSKGADTGKDGKGKVTPAKTISDAPPPAKIIGGTGVTPGDAVEKAVEDGDYEAFTVAENARALAKFRHSKGK